MLTENSDKPKALPAPEEKKRQVLHLDIDLEDLLNRGSNIEVPANQEVWKSKKEMSEDYQNLFSTLQILALYIARNINEGPEVKDNINKRLILTRTILGAIIDNLAITGYDVYGMLMEMQCDIYMRVSGKRAILQTIAQVEQAKEQLSQEKTEEYTS